MEIDCDQTQKHEFPVNSNSWKPALADYSTTSNWFFPRFANIAVNVRSKGPEDLRLRSEGKAVSDETGLVSRVSGWTCKAPGIA